MSQPEFRFSACLLGDQRSVAHVVRLAGGKAAVAKMMAATTSKAPSGAEDDDAAAAAAAPRTGTVTNLFPRSPSPLKPSVAAAVPATVASDAGAAAATPSVDLVVVAHSGDPITCSLRVGVPDSAADPSLHCDAVVLVCDSTSEVSVLHAHELVGRAGSDAPGLPPGRPIVLLDIGSLKLQQSTLEHLRSGNAAAASISAARNDGDDDDSGAASNRKRGGSDDGSGGVMGEAPGFVEMLQDLEAAVRYVGSACLDPVLFGPASPPQRRGGASSYTDDADADAADANPAALASLVRLAANGVRSPRHVLWDGRSLTEVGRQALRRAFWILDQDSGDGLLDDAEISHWHRCMYGAFSEDDVATMKNYARGTEDSYIAAGTVQARGRLLTADERVTVLGFLAVCHIMLAEGRHEPLWVMLGEQGIGLDGRPYTPEEIEDAVSLLNPAYISLGDEDDEENENETGDEDPEREQLLRVRAAQLMLHMSPAGIAFFSSLYARQRFVHPSDLFLFTPDCPWGDTYGLPNACEVDLPVHDFVSCWRYTAVVDPAAVARFARYWGFAGDLATLFVACKMRPFRNTTLDATSSTSSSAASYINQQHDQPAPTAIYLVLGSHACGKTSLMQRVADNDSGTIFADDAHPSGRSAATATVRARINNDGDVLIVLRELDACEVDACLASERFMNGVCGVVFCFDTSQPYSLSHLAMVYPRLARCPNLPIVLVMCKADLPVVDQLGLPEGPRDFCVSRGIMWPPVFTSLSHLRALPNGSELLNDVDNLTFILAEVAVNPRLVEEMALAAQRESAAATSAVYNNRRHSSRGASIGGAGEDGSAGDQSLSHSNSNNGGVSFLRTLKRATVVAALTVAAVKVGAVLWRKYEVAERFPLARRVQDSVQSVAQSAKEWLMLAAAGASSSSSSSSAATTERPTLVQLATSGTNNAENVAVAAAGATAAIAATLTTSSSNNNTSVPLQPHSNPNTASSSSSSSQATAKANGGGRQSVVVVSTVTPAQRRQEESDLLFHMDKLTNFAADQPRPAPEHYKTLKGAHAKRSWARHGEWQ